MHSLLVFFIFTVLVKAEVPPSRSLLLLPQKIVEGIYDAASDNDELFLQYSFEAFKSLVKPMELTHKLPLFPVSLAASIAQHPEFQKDIDAQSLLLTELHHAYEVGEWNGENIWRELGGEEKMYDTLPEAVEYFEIIIENSKFQFEALSWIGGLYVDSGHRSATVKMLRVLYGTVKPILDDHLEKKTALSPDDLEFVYAILGMTLWHKDHPTLAMMKEGSSYLKEALTVMDFKDLHPHCEYKSALGTIELEQIRSKLLRREQLDPAQFKQWHASIPRTFSKVDKIDYRDVSYEHFFREYVLKRKPVVLQGLVDVMTNGKNWGFDHFKKVCGRMRVEKKGHVIGQTKAWAGLVSFGETSVGEFIEELDTCHQRVSDTRPLAYVFDESLNPHCRRLLEDFVVPKYFVQDLGYMSDGNGPYKAHPSLFIGPENSTSGLHIDSSSSHFWQALFEGKKKWVFYPYQDLDAEVFLYSSPIHQSFQVDPHHPDYGTFPLFKYANEFRRLEVVVEKGEVIYIPPDIPHAVKNVEKSLAMSHNYIDASHFLRAMRHLVESPLDTVYAAFFNEEGNQPYQEAKKYMRKYPRDMPFTQMQSPRAAFPFYLSDAANGSEREDFWVDHGMAKDREDRFLSFDYPDFTASLLDLSYPVARRSSLYPSPQYANL